ncbi:helix-turn-helix transcriptional regulator [Pseudomonas floridensis]|uniref:helix-turn-helix transcriptional regulator n=1 Tax=Pseudomonas floridensis TaxID=1958950 RepID=UPI0039ED3B22
MRKEHCITQTQLAERLGVSQQTIQAYESGKRRIQVAALPELARCLQPHSKSCLVSSRKPLCVSVARLRNGNSNWKPSTNCPRANRNSLRRCSTP